LSGVFSLHWITRFEEEPNARSATISCIRNGDLLESPILRHKKRTSFWVFFSAL
jgi:hypothetical protein